MKLDVRQSLSFVGVFLTVLVAAGCGQATGPQVEASAEPEGNVVADEPDPDDGGEAAKGCYLISHDVVLGSKSAMQRYESMGCIRIAGDLVVHESVDVAQLSALHGLRSVDGSLVVTGNAALGCVQLPHLEWIGEDMVVAENAELRSLAAPGLVSVGSRLNIDANPRLAALDLPRLETVGGNLECTENAALAQCTFDEWADGIDSVGGKIRAGGNSNECPAAPVSAQSVGCMF